MSTTTGGLITLAIFFASGLFLIFIGLRQILRARHAARTFSRATGTVVEYRVSTDMEHSTLYHPIVEFSTSDGRQFRVECLWSKEIVNPIGSSIILVYDPREPEKAEPLDESQTAAILIIALGLFACGLCLSAAFLIMFGIFQPA